MLPTQPVQGAYLEEQAFGLELGRGASSRSEAVKEMSGKVTA